jgi:hypothetical protein
MRAILRLAAAVSLLTLFILFAPPLREGVKSSAGNPLDEPLAEAGGFAETVRAAAAKDMRAFKIAHEGMACLSGDGPCPNGQPNPFR